MSAINLALKLGSQLIEAKLQKLAVDPVSVYPPATPGVAAPNAISNAELPTTNLQKKQRSAKVHPPRVITVR